MPDVQIESKDRTHPFPKGEYMPFKCDVLTKSLIDYAFAHLNETEEVREKALQEVREYIKTELGFHNKLNDMFLLCYLRTRKFDVKRTCMFMKKTLEFAESYRYYVDRVELQSVRQVVDSKTIGFLPYRDSKSRAIVFVKSENWDPDKIKAEDIIFGSIVALHMALKNPINQVAGYIVILDFKNLKLQQMIAMSSWLIFGIQALQKCCPCIVKEFHVLHMPAFSRICWKMTKHLISEKIRKRIKFYKSDSLEKLHRTISPAILPEELGGNLGPFCNEHWGSNLPSIMKEFDEKLRIFLHQNKTDP